VETASARIIQSSHEGARCVGASRWGRVCAAPELTFLMPLRTCRQTHWQGRWMRPRCSGSRQSRLVVITIDQCEQGRSASRTRRLEAGEAAVRLRR
jgi:hypothetical protein